MPRDQPAHEIETVAAARERELRLMAILGREAPHLGARARRADCRGSGRSALAERVEQIGAHETDAAAQPVRHHVAARHRERGRRESDASRARPGRRWPRGSRGNPNRCRDRAPAADPLPAAMATGRRAAVRRCAIADDHAPVDVETSVLQPRFAQEVRQRFARRIRQSAAPRAARPTAAERRGPAPRAAVERNASTWQTSHAASSRALRAVAVEQGARRSGVRSRATIGRRLRVGRPPLQASSFSSTRW